MHKLEQINLIEKLPLEGLSKKGDNKYKCFCWFCQKVKKGKVRKAGFFWRDGKFIYSCFKCGESYSLIKLVKTYFRDQVRATLYDNFMERSSVNSLPIDTNKIDNNDYRIFVEGLLKEKKLIPYSQMPEEAKYYLNDRNIPEGNQKNMFYTDNMFDIYYKYKQIRGEEKGNQYAKTGSESLDKRVVWLFRDRNNMITGMQGRSISGREPKYIIVKFNDEIPIVGNLENVDLAKPVLITEGYIDSLFLPNAASMNGAKWQEVYGIFKYLGAKKIVFVFDNDFDNDNIRQMVNAVIKASLYDAKLAVYMFPKEWKEKGKDVNEYIQNGISREEIINNIDQNSFNGIKAKITFHEWV